MPPIDKMLQMLFMKIRLFAVSIFIIFNKFTCMLFCVAQVQKKGKETCQAQKQLKMDLAAIEAVC